jgi:hypothetical protein
MKNTRLLLKMVIILLMCFIFTACAEEEKDEEDTVANTSVFGYWKKISGEQMAGLGFDSSDNFVALCDWWYNPDEFCQGWLNESERKIDWIDGACTQAYGQYYNYVISGTTLTLYAQTSASSQLWETGKYTKVSTFAGAGFTDGHCGYQ